MSNSNDDVFRTRANTFAVKDPKGIAGYVLKIKPEDLTEFVSELSHEDYSVNGATIFLNVFENESKFDEGKTYLSSTLSPIPTEDFESSGKGRDTSRLNKKISSKYNGKVSSRSNSRGR